MTDVELAKRLAAGEQGALAEFVDRFHAPVFRYLWQAGGSREDAEDLATQTLLRARHDAHRFRGEGQLRAWVFRIAYRELLQYRRRQAVFTLWQRRAKLSEQPPPNEDAVVVTAALGQLSVAHRAAFLLTEVEGLSADEAGQALGVPAGTVRSRAHYAKRRLREILAPAYPELNHAEPLPE